MAVSSEVTLFNANRISNSIKESAVWVESGKLSVEEAKNDITIALTQAYLQALYNKEEISIAEENLEASANQDLAASLSQLEAAKVQLGAANESYRLSEQQFELGMLNLADFILQKANYQTAQQAYLHPIAKKYKEKFHSTCQNISFNSCDRLKKTSRFISEYII